METAIRILIADDHDVVLRGLEFYLKTHKDLEIVGTARNGRQALEQVSALRPDVVLMDLVMPEMDGIQATAEIRRLHPETKVLVLTSFMEQDQVVPAIRAGATGYLLKDVQPDELVAAIRATCRGESRLHPAVMERLMAHVTDADEGEAAPPEPLTPRESEVLQLIARGLSNKEIAGALRIHETTVKSHVSNILSKLGLEDRTQAAVYAVRHGLDGGGGGAGG